MMELAADGFFQTDWERMWEWARKALAVARELDDPPLVAATTALAATADAFAGLIDGRPAPLRRRPRRCSTR